MTYKDGWDYLVWELTKQFKLHTWHILFVVFVLGDCLTTYQMYMNNPNFVDLNPNIHMLRDMIPNPAIFYIVFVVIKLIALEVILTLINFQNSKMKHTGYITFFMILLASVYVIINNLQVLNLI